MNDFKEAKLKAEQEIEKHIKDNYLNRIFNKHADLEIKRYLKIVEQKYNGLIEINSRFDWSTKSFNIEVKENHIDLDMCFVVLKEMAKKIKEITRRENNEQTSRK